MKLKKDSSDQKLRGAYYTPLDLAESMISLLSLENVSNVLEPSCGDGVFIESFEKLNLLNDIRKITAIEIEDSVAKIVKKKFNKNKNVSILNQDFLDFYEDMYLKESFDLIVGNPPFIRYQYLSERQREAQSKILYDRGMKSNKLINSWVCFVVACTQMLSDEGKISFVLPAELLQVAYAEDLRLFLSNQFAKITLITFEKLVFSEIEQEVIVFIAEKGTDEKGIRVIELNDLSDLNDLNLDQYDYQLMNHVKEKWTKYFISKDEIELIQNLRGDIRFTQFSEYGTINVGITTGNNNYFSITQDIADKYDLNSVTLPLIGRSSHTHGIYFTENDWNSNLLSGKKARLINFPDIPFKQYPELHKKYILKGENEDENLGYKVSIRNRWYIIPSIWVPDAFFLRRNNLYPKFVLNRCGAVSTDTMHRIKFNQGIDHEEVLLSYYNSISFAFTEICGRSYGGGVLEVLPREMGNILLPKLENIPLEVKRDVLNRINNVVGNKEDIELALDIVDQEILINIVGIEQDVCSKCRLIWKKLQKRRLGRN